jgi:hypothetical protein
MKNKKELFQLKKHNYFDFAESKCAKPKQRNNEHTKTPTRPSSPLWHTGGAGGRK